MRALDISYEHPCILAYIPNVKCYGFTISKNYISLEEYRYKLLGEFHCKDVNTADLDNPI